MAPIQRPEDGRAIDRWVRLSLSQRYAQTLREPLPDALLELLAQETE